MEYIEALEAYQASIADEIAALGLELSRLDKATQDFLHYIEFTVFNANESNRVMNNFKQIRQERRKIKDKMEVLHDIKRKIAQAEESGYKLGKKQYRYRILKPKSIKGEVLQWKAC